MACICPIEDGIEAIEIFRKYTHNCFYDGLDVTSYIFGLINIGFWMCAQFPQLYKTFKTKKPESLSITFLVMWLGGDITNLLGCIFTDQTQVQLLTSVYFVLIDIIMLSQYAWYLLICRKKYHKEDYQILSSDSSIATPPDNISDDTLISEEDLNDNYSQVSNSRFVIVLMTLLCVFAQEYFMNSLDESDDLPYCGEKDYSLLERIIGDVSAWVSGLLYFFGRIPQIIHIYRTKNVDGLSILLFIMATIANIFYSLSLFISGIDLTDPTFYEAKLAYIIGSFFVIPMSLVVIAQYYYYKYIKNWWIHRKDEKQPLLTGIDQ
ncbi:PQ loop repeat protein [Entamoeba histolytica HM-1:IMSS-B]|uniref:PQ loop repeat protein n=5 Tax=Entamoeba histolytica TaxID=5759 RepID=C4LT11_ENTH1|nr:PQ loop repeat protein [Entamoeba histolytica HM-1:IMSS]EMD42832.1 PQ loop repeatcontaining protein [Entamoeba histolytica KU27]EMH72225.1 PQ loop repeat protein [Entamoeba histolytica HM-1:IMSS-B]ENY59751.1 PQ loop repeat protein [Entamoeba histolytica HM-1:IMSS-A]GAT91679.1 pq loop repeat protein [Entamoeba histolytica]EAL52109.1 PQ loop repeat protein [Entamoeba histolytica HM-1:IMSS]|eukprot:XP_657499.1 PQ loop repeat protein [Entamoeba histolytica HM-1:IMSS]